MIVPLAVKLLWLAFGLVLGSVGSWTLRIFLDDRKAKELISRGPCGRRNLARSSGVKSATKRMREKRERRIEPGFDE